MPNYKRCWKNDMFVSNIISEKKPSAINNVGGSLESNDAKS